MLSNHLPNPGNRLHRLSFLTLLACIISTPVQAAWTVLDSGTSNNLYGVEFPVDENTGYVVGTGGTILKTSDAGASWDKLKTHTRDNLTDIDFVNNQIGYATGINGTLLKTIDGGSSWSAMNTGTTQHLNSVNFPVDANTGYIGGIGPTLLKTTDGGLTWTPQFVAEGSVKAIVFPNDDVTGYVSTIYGTLGYIYKTIDGGLNWTRVLYLEDAFLYSMSFPLDDQVGYIANYDTYTQHGIWKTIDGGVNWDFITQGLTAVPVAVDFPVDVNTGLAVGFSGSVMKTTDAGATWTEGSLGVDASMRDLDFINNNVGYAVGSGGVIVKTSDGGSASIESLYLHPIASGSINTFTDMVGCSSDWDCVNDQLANLSIGLPATVHSQTYVADSSGNRAMFALADGALNSTQSVTEICVSIAATQWYGPYASLSYQRMGSDPAPVDSVPFWLGNYWYNGINTHCWSNLNWTTTDLDNLEIGVKTVDGQWVELAQLFVKVFYRP